MTDKKPTAAEVIADLEAKAEEQKAKDKAIAAPINNDFTLNTKEQELAKVKDKTEADVMTQAFSWRTINAISDTEFIPRSLRKRPAAILACILAGREIGLPPMESLRSIDIIDGKVSPSAELMLNLIRQAGHRVQIVESNDKLCTLKGTRKPSKSDQEAFGFGATNLETQETTFTIEQAKRAGLVGKTNWKNYPEAMLYWRALTVLARQLFPDVISALKYLPEELGSDTWHEDIPEDYDPSSEPPAPEVDDEGDIVEGELVDEEGYS